MRLIDADALYERLKQDEEMARNRVLDTDSSLPYPNNLNPSYTRYVAQMEIVMIMDQCDRAKQVEQDIVDELKACKKIALRKMMC